MAARETLGVTGWPAIVAAPAAALERGVKLATALAALGAADDALRVLDRWALGDPRLAGPRFVTPPLALPDPRARQLLAAARIAFGAGRWATGIRYARTAFEAVPDSESATRWGVAPWIMPPAFDSLYAPGGNWSGSRESARREGSGAGGAALEP